MQDLGFVAHNSILVLNTVAVVLVWFGIKAVLALLLRPCQSRHQKIEQARGWLKEGLIFNALIELYLSAYLEFIISSILTVQFGTYAYYGEVLSLSITFFSIVFGLLFLPIAAAWVIFQSEERLEDDAVADTIGELYQSVGGRGFNRFRLAYPLLLTLRRLIIVWLAFWVARVGQQGIAMCYVNLFMLVYQGANRAGLSNITKNDNRIALFNEFSIGVSTFLYLGWAGVIADEDVSTSYTHGWTMCALISLVVVVNFARVLRSNYRDMRMLRWRWYYQSTHYREAQRKLRRDLIVGELKRR